MRTKPSILAAMIFALVMLLIGGSSSNAIAQKTSGLNAYRSVSIGMKRDEVRDKLGKVKDEFPDEDDFEPTDNESARIFYDADKIVRAMVITYGKIDTAPAPKVVLGEEVTPNPDGGMYKMVRFPDEGFWVSYVKTAGDKPTIIITLQGLPKQS